MSEQESKEKRKNTEGEVEWSFDFGKLGESIKGMANSLAGLAGDEEIQESTFIVAKDNAESARVKVDFAAGKNFLNALEAGSDNLVEAHLKHVGEIEFSEEGDTTKTVRIKQKGRIKDIATPIKQGLRLVANSDAIEWQVHLSPDVPLSLEVNGGVGPTRVDMTGLNVRNLKFDAGVGQFTLTLPEQDGEIDLDINTGVGETKIYLPENTNANLDIDAGVGSVDVTIPPNAAVQVRASNGLGSVQVPQSLRRISKKGDFIEQGGVWQSEGFDLAERRIVIRYDGGVGAFHVREAEMV